MTAEQLKSIPRCTLEQLYAEHSGRVSDKWSAYLTEYGRIFDEYRDKPVRLLELGIQNGGSLEIWSKFFPNARKLVGCDINADCTRLSYEDPRIAVVIGDANSDAVQAAILEHAPAFDLILDDGSHRSSDIARSFARYFPFLVDGGIYTIEDLHCSYWKEYEGGLYHPYSSIAFFKQLCDVINYEHWGVEKSRPEFLHEFFSRYGLEIHDVTLQHIHSIEFINSICVIRRAHPARCTLGKRVIAGSVATVAPRSLALQSRDCVTPSQTANEWSVRDGDLEARLEAHDAEIKVLASKGQARDSWAGDLKAKLSARERDIRELKTSTSWRITKPLRAVSRGLRWLLRNTRRALMLMW